MTDTRSCITHPKSPPLTICRTVLNESVDLDILGMTFNIWFQDYFWEASLLDLQSSFSKAGYLSWRSPGEYLLTDCSLMCFQDSVLPVLEYSFAVWCLAANTHLKLMDGAVSGTSFLTEVVLEYNIAHSQSITVLWMLFKIRCNQMHPLNGILPMPQVPVGVTPGH